MPPATESTSTRHALAYPFDHDHGTPGRELTNLLGGKGAGLAEMTAALGIAVPPGFTIPVPVCLDYREHGWPDDLDAELRRQVGAIENKIGRRFGDPTDPLLVAVRSGAPVSMPGMLDTVLNLGLNDDTVRGLATVSGDEWFAWDSYRRFLSMFATIVLGVEADDLRREHEADTADELRAEVESLQQRIERTAGRSIPQDPVEQLRAAVEAVFASWDCDRAKAYRSHESIDDSLGTAVNVQAMVFGNRGTDSGTGVVFTRDPSTGHREPYGDYLPRAQGEDVVAGSAKTLPIAQLGELDPALYDELVTVLRKLETHYRDICDVEFTVEGGHLWLLQTRAGKRGAVAAVRAAVHLTDDPDVRLTRREAVERVPQELRSRARAEILAEVTDDSGADLLTTGLGASSGRVCGRIVLDSDAAMDADDDVILVRRETSPEDVAGMSASVGVLTTRGGLVSHAAVVARGWGIPAVVGAGDIEWRADELVIGERTLHAGDVVTIDGASGCVWAGELGAAAAAAEDIDSLLPELAVLEQWAAELKAD